MENKVCVYKDIREIPLKTIEILFFFLLVVGLGETGKMDSMSNLDFTVAKKKGFK